MSTITLTNSKHRLPVGSVLSLGLMLTAMLWAYWSTVSVMAARWAFDPMYSHGFVVPVVAIALIWWRRNLLTEQPLSVSWWGLPLLGIAVVCRLASTHFYFEWFDALSLVPCLAGICLLVGGWPAMRVAWPAIVFFGFMVPLPFTLETAMAGPLQSIATKTSTYLLQTFGYPAVAEGHSIAIGQVSINVAQACSGLRMLVVFIAAATAVALFSKRPVWERLLIVASAAPIALFGNVIRITSTGILHEVAGRALADLVFHDLAGWLMMLLAVALLRLELWVLDHVLIDVPERQVVPVMAARGMAIPVRTSPSVDPATNTNRTAASRDLAPPPVTSEPGAESVAETPVHASEAVHV